MSWIRLLTSLNTKAKKIAMKSKQKQNKRPTKNMNDQKTIGGKNENRTTE